VTKGHGRIESRSIRTSVDLVGYVDFPYAAQVFSLRRHTTDLRGKHLRSELVYGITSLSRGKANPQQVLGFNRAQWSIENKVHWVRDVTFDEDRSRVRKKAGPQVMASLRNLVISLLRMAGADNIAQGLRRCSWNKDRVFRIIGFAFA
jgi:hypothetical protein